MKMDHETIHMALAVYSSDNPDHQIRKMARRYHRREHSSRARRIYKQIMKDPHPSQTALEVYEERFNQTIH